MFYQPHNPEPVRLSCDSITTPAHLCRLRVTSPTSGYDACAYWHSRPDLEWVLFQQWATARPCERKSRVPMVIALSVILVITSLLLMVLILLHRGKGGGLSSMFGGGVSSNLSGSSVAEKNLDRMTIICGLVWAICIVGVGLLLKVES